MALRGTDHPQAQAVPLTSLQGSSVVLYYHGPWVLDPHMRWDTTYGMTITDEYFASPTVTCYGPRQTSAKPQRRLWPF